MSPLNDSTFWAELPGVLLQEMLQGEIGAFLFAGTVLFIAVAIGAMGWSTICHQRHTAKRPWLE